MSITGVHIKQVFVESYKSLKNSKIELKRGLNVIIGKNGAGKSNMLEFIYYYAARNFLALRLPIRPLTQSFQVSIEYIDNKISNLLDLQVERLKKNDTIEQVSVNYSYEVTINKKKGGKNELIDQKYITGTGNTEFRKLLIKDDTLRKEMEVFRYLPRTFIGFQYPRESFWVSKPTKFTLNIDENEVIFDNSEFEFRFFADIEWEIESQVFDNADEKVMNDMNLLKKNLINSLTKLINKKGINKVLKKFSPISEIRINPNINIYSNGTLIIVENLSIDFFIEKNWMPWSYLSDGTKRIFHLLTEVITSEGGIILVEEPELGIHPHQLFKILEFLKEQSLTKQIVISTHSPIVLDILDENELDRISIASFNKGSKFVKLTKTQMEKAVKYIREVGELSYYWLHSDLEK
jgi:AAA15 family ATPase/GTPase